MTPPAEPTSLRYPTFLFFLGAAWELLLVGKKQHNTKPRSVPENLCIVLILDALTEHPQLRGGTLKKCSPHEYQFLGKPHHQCKNVSFVGFLKEFSSAAISTIAKTPNRKAYIYIYIYIASLFAISGMWMERSFDYHLNDRLGITYD